MHNVNSNGVGYVFAAAGGAVAGGLFVVVATKAISKMMSQLMPVMMQNMMAHMKEAGCTPEEM